MLPKPTEPLQLPETEHWKFWVPPVPGTPPPIRLFEVGGYIRDQMLGVVSKDIDFSVVSPSYEVMRDWLVGQGFEIFLEKPEYLSIRARFPKELSPLFVTQPVGQAADFVMSRKDGAYSDGRRPDEVTPGTIFNDLARRDFSVNAMARCLHTGVLLDPHGGLRDLREHRLRAVGSAEERLREDALRALRAIRFSVTKNLAPDLELAQALQSDWLPPLLASVSTERRREELYKAMRHNTPLTLRILNALPVAFTEAVFCDGLWLEPTLKHV